MNLEQLQSGEANRKKKLQPFAEKRHHRFLITINTHKTRMLIAIDTSDFIEAAEGQANLRFADEKQQGKFELAVCMAIYKWDELNTAVDNLWGGPKSADKRDWISGVIIELFDEKVVDLQLIEETLLYAMVDEFEAEIDNDSALEIAVLILKFYRQVAQGKYDEILALYDKWQLKQQSKKLTTEIQIGADPNNPDAETSSEDEGDDQDDVPMLQTESNMEVDEPQGPIVDDDGFELVQSKGKRGSRR